MSIKNDETRGQSKKKKKKEQQQPKLLIDLSKESLLIFAIKRVKKDYEYTAKTRLFLNHIPVLDMKYNLFQRVT